MPTLRQKRYVNFLISTGGRRYRAARAAGYSHFTARNCAEKIENSKGYTQLARAELPELFIAENLRRLMEQDKNLNVSFSALEIAMRLRGFLP